MTKPQPKFLARLKASSNAIQTDDREELAKLVKDSTDKNRQFFVFQFFVFQFFV